MAENQYTSNMTSILFMVVIYGQVIYTAEELYCVILMTEISSVPKVHNHVIKLPDDV